MSAKTKHYAECYSCHAETEVICDEEAVLKARVAELERVLAGMVEVFGDHADEIPEYQRAVAALEKP